MHTQMQVIFGDDFEKRFKQQPFTEEHTIRPSDEILTSGQRPTRLRYFVPRKYRPDEDDPWPCLLFRSGDVIQLEPVFNGGCDRDKIRWTISPKLPSKIGLVFDTKNGNETIWDSKFPDLYLGVISGRIPTYSRTDAAWIEPLEQLLKGSQLPNIPSNVFSPPAFTEGTAHVSFPRTTFTITCRNSAGLTRTRVTFQVVPYDQSDHFHSSYDRFDVHHHSGE